ncbi:L-lactate dehydrogenase (cytochrome)/(S)-mandelate dehydrogenase [Breoghania corrubedonensis]|uniref:L-lactate dehydrogenase (Cytochrome)/(S)-mandelate dehydrogenase n=1 Tax=Breoghania corrubedonensis TaxID=665038 RepID=A0A2T5VB53_9HYPH|nr:alpha-hydroxy acid oxidase [Breoghania corrubedonensis]PTW60974.1 L-lactate dehydrogenase (cytochrome)/(S)-mandelate dehydrogenase [Breoghania corrubedonensis]
MGLDRIHTIADLRRLARRRAPRMAFDFLDGGAGEGLAVEENEAALARIKLLPRTLRDVSARTQAVELFARRLRGPIGISPVGFANVIWPQTDTILARMAQEAGIPYMLSTAASTSIEEIVKVAPDAWFQLYVSDSDEIAFDMLRRAKEAGVKVVVLTVDVPLPGRRYRDMRNGFSLPLRPSLSTMLDFALRPAWIRETIRHGTPTFANYAPYMKEGANAGTLAAFMASQVSPNLSPERIRRLRDAWSGTFIVKGILSAEDALDAADLGADGLIVSNHGGRQLEAAPAAINLLPEVVRVVGGRMPVMMDGGIRTGADIVKAYCLGADYVFAGRPFIFSTAAAGADGARRALEIFHGEVDQTLGQIGATSMADLDETYIRTT